jgi:hypothetical protein
VIGLLRSILVGRRLVFWRTHNPPVVGSSPTRPTRFRWSATFPAWHDLDDRVADVPGRGSIVPPPTRLHQRILGPAAPTSDPGGAAAGPRVTSKTPRLPHRAHALVARAAATPRSVKVEGILAHETTWWPGRRTELGSPPARRGRLEGPSLSPDKGYALMGQVRGVAETGDQNTCFLHATRR